ncbi:MAG: helix-turn-helix domain-containing protein [Planctomycetota bacterium]
MPRLATPVRILWAARFDYAAGDRLPLHDHGHWQAICLRQGRGRLSLAGRGMDLAPGLALIPPDTEHGLHAETLVSSLDIKFHCPQGVLERQLRRLPHWHQPAPAGWATGIEAIVAWGREPGPWSRAQAELRLSGLLLDLLTRATEVPPPAAAARSSCGDALIDALGERFAAACDESWPQQRMAQAAGYSYRQLSNRCHRALGCTPQALLERIRIERARELLLASDYTVEAIAIRCGFATAQHLARRFRAHTGCSPARWRNREREQIGIGVTFASDFVNQIRLTRGT